LILNKSLADRRLVNTVIDSLSQGKKERVKGVRKIVVDSFQSRLHSLSLVAKEKEKKTLSDCFFLSKWHKLRGKAIESISMAHTFESIAIILKEPICLKAHVT